MQHTTNTTQQSQLIKNQTIMQNNLNIPAGLASRLQTIFNYHYDAIMRDIEVELLTLQATDPKHAADLHDHFTAVLEEGWPISEDELIK